MLEQKDSLNKNLKDTQKDSIKDTSFGDQSLTPWHKNFNYYNKINKLITALYMVTDTMDKDEPMRIKLRTLGVEILSDTTSLQNSIPDKLNEEIATILSFLDIASDLRMVSEMNCNILKKEFIQLRESIQEFTTQNHLWFEQFILRSPENEESSTMSLTKDNPSLRNMSFNKGQVSNRIGVQKGSTLMKALNKIEGVNSPAPFEAIKKERRELIIKVIKDKPDGMSIKDITLVLQGLGKNWGGKTLQRELVSMIKDNVLKKTGEKRWSIYSLVSNN